MIFVTVGTQLPFDRLVRAVDGWAGDNPQAEIFAQIGDADYRPSHMGWAAYLPAERFRATVAAARLIVSHAGVGCLLTALQAGKPVIVMPRRAAFHEHRDDHQCATARRLRRLPGVTIAEDPAALVAALGAGIGAPPRAISPVASAELLAAITAFLSAF